MDDNANPTPILQVWYVCSTRDESSSTEVNVGWGRQEWGLQGWGIAGTLFLQVSSASLGSVTTTADANTGPSTNNNQLLRRFGR